ncbi:MAG: GTP cyclohydrolase II [Planctomycetes bacterium]|nr:GTP cyclohydrolase II [Planctomycetota bacterium]
MPDKKLSHIRLTSHPGKHGPKPLPVQWGAATPKERGPLIATLSNSDHRNVIGTHSGSYAIYRALAVASGTLDPEHKADLTNTRPSNPIGPHPAWHDPKKIVSLDPYGAVVIKAYADRLSDGYDIRPSIAITQAHIHMPELSEAIEAGRIKPDGKFLTKAGEVAVTKAAIEPVWYLPGIAERFKIEESTLRRALFEHTGGMFPELVTRGDLEVFFPPIGGQTVYIFGDPDLVSDPNQHLAVRVHDECNGSDVFGSDICTCRPYLAHGVEVCVESVLGGGSGVIVYNRKEGRALGEVTKFLVYNARKRQEGGDRASEYFTRTECVAGVQDMRFQVLMPDSLHWLGITKIDRFVSMSNLKYDPLVASGIEVKERLSIPEDRIPADARVEMDAKKAAGYYTEGEIPSAAELGESKGRELDA